MREAVALRYRQGLSYAEIADGCGVSVVALRVRVARALPLLRKCLKGKGVEPELRMLRKRSTGPVGGGPAAPAHFETCPDCQKSRGAYDRLTRAMKDWGSVARDEHWEEGVWRADPRRLGAAALFRPLDGVGSLRPRPQPPC